MNESSGHVIAQSGDYLAFPDVTSYAVGNYTPAILEATGNGACYQYRRWAR